MAGSVNYALCGTPDDCKIRLYQYGPKVCPDCYRLIGKIQRCLKCDTEFQPGCRRRFHCNNCANWNAAH
jgi:hypothetical protein